MNKKIIAINATTTLPPYVANMKIVYLISNSILQSIRVFKETSLNSFYVFDRGMKCRCQFKIV